MTRRATRKTVQSFGQKRRGDFVRVLFDAKRDRYEVHYHDTDGAKRRRVFPGDKAGKAEASAFAEAFVEERRRLADGPARKPIPRTTVRQLWTAFTEAPAFSNLRPKSRINYAERFGKWERYIGKDAIADLTTLHDVDGFIQRAAVAGMAINQVRQCLNVARIVYNWGQTRKLVAVNELALHRWKRPKDAVVHEPEEYSDAEYVALLRVVSPQDTRTWRLWVALMLAGHHAQRANAVLHLRWRDIDTEDDRIIWPAEYQKSGDDLTQPLTWEAVAAFETARYWIRLPTGRAFTKMNHHQRLTAEAISRTPWVLPGQNDGSEPYGYQALWRALRAAETRAGVEHRPYRALHGFRKMVAGNVADRTGDDRLAMEWIGDKDMKQARAYLRRRDERLQRAADAASGEKR